MHLKAFEQKKAQVICVLRKLILGQQGGATEAAGSLIGDQAGNAESRNKRDIRATLLNTDSRPGTGQPGLFHPHKKPSR